ncbi:MAG: nicotinate-nucleotide adenylyltransferase [Caldisericaceae bacterium]
MEANLSSSKKVKIGIYGGAFNPIHIGHLFVGKESIRLFNLDKVIFVPTGNPVFRKKDLLDKYIRAHLVEIAIEGETNFEISYFEIEKEGPSYYIDTLRNFIKDGVDIYTIIGEDAFLKITLWKDFKEILSNSNFIVAKRLSDNFATLKEFTNENLNDFTKKIFTLEHPLFPISSTLIRERLKTGLPISYLVPKPVENEILRHGYYTKRSSFG